jgi:signal transduction histidine kinase
MALLAQIGIERASEQAALSMAFSSFSEAAASLERAYGKLEQQVEALRLELEQRNAELERSLAEKDQLRSSLHQILEGLPCGVLTLSSNGRIASSNPAARALLGGDPGIAGGSEPSVIGELLQLAASTQDGAELEMFAEKGGSRWLLMRSAPLASAGGQVFVLQDRTEARRAAAERERREREQALASMAVLLAHEVRNPLGSLELFAGLLADSELSGEYRGWVDHIHGGLRLLSSTVNNVLRFHSPSDGIRLPTDLGLLLSWLQGFLRPLAQPANVHLRVVNELDGVHMTADRHALEQLLLNLCLNALRFMPDGGLLKIQGHRQQNPAGALASIEVADSGPGVPPEFAERIFDAGFSTCPGSPGLGLAVSQAVAQRHGGRILLAKSESRGATFVVELPLGEVR